MFGVIDCFYLSKSYGNLWSICLGVNILRTVCIVDFNGNNPLLKVLITLP